MIGIGFLLMALGAVGTWLLWKKRITETRWFHRLALWALALPFFANLFGWTVTEIGRQPWVVYGELLVRDGVSPGVAAGEVITTLVGFTLIYGVLAAVDIYLMRKYARQGVTAESTPDEVAASMAY
jgi:cytochrome d ubiquinol oxidase subunit I